MWICWVVMLTVAHSLWPVSRLSKCLSWAIKFEYRIRPDWQDIMLLMATGFTNKDLVRVWLPTASIFIYIHRISGSQYVVGCYYGKLLVCWLYFMWWYLCQRGMWNWPQRGRFARPSSPSIHIDTLTEATSTSWAPLCHDGLCDPPGGVCPFGKWGVAASVSSRGPIKPAGYKGTVKELRGFSFQEKCCIVLV